MRKSIKRKIIKNKKSIFLIMIAVVIVCTSVYYAATILYNGVSVSYDNTTSGMTSTDVQSAIDEIYDAAAAKPNITSAFNLGDYFTLVPDASTYTMKPYPIYTADQTITPNELTLWRVILIHGDGSVDAVSEYVSSKSIYLEGTSGYQRFVESLESLAPQYSKSGYTVDTRIMGYTGKVSYIPTRGSCTTSECYWTSTSMFDGSYNGYTPWSGTTSLLYDGVGEESMNGVNGDTMYLRDVILVGNVYKKDSTYGTYGLKAYNTSGTATAYWLNSRVRSYTSSYYSSGRYYRYYWYFDGLYVTTAGNLSTGAHLRYRYKASNSSTISYTNVSKGYPIRPIITLRPGITIASGAGTKASPYILN